MAYHPVASLSGGREELAPWPTERSGPALIGDLQIQGFDHGSDRRIKRDLAELPPAGTAHRCIW